MSDEKWTTGDPENEFTTAGSSVDDTNIVDGTAEVIDETAGTAAGRAKEYETAT